MIVVVAGEIDFAPEVRDTVLTDAQPLIDMALAEQGCRHYAWSLDPHHPGRIHVFEEWETAEDLAAHLLAESYFKMGAHLAGFTILGAVTRKYRCDLSEPVYGPDGVATATFLTAKD
jgi:quinol monooxygenase YgiN